MDIDIIALDLAKHLLDGEPMYYIQSKGVVLHLQCYT